VGVRKRADGGAARDTNLAKLLPRGFEVRILLRKRTMEFTQAYPVNESECVSRDCGIVGRIEGLLHALPVGTVGKADAKKIGQFEAMYAAKARLRHSRISGYLKGNRRLRRSVLGKW